MNATRTRKTKSSASTRGRTSSQGRSGQGKGSQSRGTPAKKSSRAQARGASSRKRGGSTASRGGSPAARKSSKTGRKASSQSRPASRASGTTIGQAIAILAADHKMVQQMFRQGERARNDPERLRALVEAACAALTLHAEIEEQHLYPVMRALGKDTDMIAEAYVEHASAKQLIAELQGGDPGDEEYAAKFKVLGEYVKHHVKEEETQIFPKARRARGDFRPLLEALVARDEAVLAEGREEAGSSRTTGRGRAKRNAASSPAAPARRAQGASSERDAPESMSPTSSRRGASDTLGSSARDGTRGRQGRGRPASESTAEAESSSAMEDAGESSLDTAATADTESPRRARRGGRDDAGDQETGSTGREADSEETDTRTSRQGNR